MLKLKTKILNQLTKIALLIAVVIGTSFAAYPTTADTTINSTTITVQKHGSIITANYNTDLAVASIYGFEIAPSNSVTLNIYQLAPSYLPYQVINRGNITDNVNITLDYAITYWSHRFVMDNNYDGIHQPAESTVITFPVPLASQSTLNFFVEMTPVSRVSADIGIKFYATGMPNGSYLGFNNVNYAGTGNFKVTDNIIFYDDRPPYISVFAPTNNSVEVPENQVIRINTEDDETGVNPFSINIGLTNIVESIGIAYTTQNSYVMAMINGVIQPGFQVTQVLDSDGGYDLLIAPIYGFSKNSEVSVSINFSDLAVTPNRAQYNYSFHTGGVDQQEFTGTRTLVVPTVFDPGKEDAKIYFNLTEDSNVKLLIYDLSGNLVHTASQYFTVGYKYFVWDGMGSNVIHPGNGVYLVYLTKDRGSKKIIGRTKCVIMREGS